MEFVCLLSSVPIRKEPTSSSEKVSALLFGEKCTLIEEVEDWVKIKSNLDNYEGYISRERLEPIESNSFTFTKRVYAPFLIAKSKNKQILIPCGSYIPESLEFVFDNEPYQIEEVNNIEKNPIGLAKQYLNTPYNWGGRSIFGLDCSGLMQVIFSLNGLMLPRDAYQQIESGTLVTFEERKAGDLAYFANPKGRISHVGILSSRETIIHAAGYVREDKFTQKGVFRSSNQTYTHYLHSIKRL